MNKDGTRGESRKTSKKRLVSKELIITLCVQCRLALFVRPQDLQILKFRHPTPGGRPASGAGGVRAAEGKKSPERQLRERGREGENY